MHTVPSYLAFAAVLLAGAALVRIAPAPAEHEERPAHPVTIDLRVLQNLWAWVRGRGERVLRREMAATSHYLQRVRNFADAVLDGSMSHAEAHDELMHGRYGSIRTRCACAEQLSAFVHANVPRPWLDDDLVARLRAARG